MNLGERLKKVRILLGLTQKDFAKNLSVTKQLISMIETNAIKPSKMFLLLVEKVYGISMAWLLHWEGEMFIKKISELQINPHRELTDRLNKILMDQGSEVHKFYITALLNQIDLLDQSSDLTKKRERKQ